MSEAAPADDRDVIRLFGTVGQHGRWCLVIGLLAGLTQPALALALKPWLPEMIAGLLFLAALRIGPKAATGGLEGIQHTLKTSLFYQMIAPLIALSLFLALGVASQPWALAMVLVLAAPPVTGSPNFTILLDQDPAVSMRLLLVGTAIFPLTVIPVLIMLPAVDTISGVLISALRLLLVVVGSVGLAFAIRHFRWPSMSPTHQSAIDGISAILLGIVVIGLMSAVGPALVERPAIFLTWLAFALALNFGLQLAAAHSMPLREPSERAGTAIVAGNRNIALFLVALPEATTDMLLLFIGCYQVPMYLTPILMRRVLSPTPG